MVEVVNLFKVIVEEFPELDGNNFVIMSLDMPAPSLAKGYELTIRKKKPIDDKTLDKLQAMVTKQKLKMETKKETILIYEPVSKNSQI